MLICIYGEPEPEAFGKACQRAVAFNAAKGAVDIYCPERKADGWLEYHLSFKNDDGRQHYLIAMIQREKEGAYEFHS